MGQQRFQVPRAAAIFVAICAITATACGGKEAPNDSAPPDAAPAPGKCEEAVEGAMCPLTVECVAGKCVGTSNGFSQGLTPAATCDHDVDCALTPCDARNPCDAWVYDGKQYGQCVSGRCKIGNTFYTAAYNCVLSCSRLNLEVYNTNSERECHVSSTDPSTHRNCVVFTNPEGLCQINSEVADPACIALSKEYRSTITCVPAD